MAEPAPPENYFLDNMKEDKKHLRSISNVVSISKNKITVSDQIKKVRSFMDKYNTFIDEQLKAGFIPRLLLVTQLELDGHINQFEFVHNLDHSDLALLLIHVQNRLVNDDLDVSLDK